MRPDGIVPFDENIELGLHLSRQKWNQKASRPLALERAKESLDDGDTTLLTNGSEARFDVASGEPTVIVSLRLLALEIPKLGALV